MNILEIGIEMKKFRKANNYTQADLAKLLNISKQTVSSYENGKTQPNMATLIRFSQLSKMPIEEIVFFEKIKTLYSDFDTSVIESFRDVCDWDFLITHPSSTSDYFRQNIRQLYENNKKIIDAFK